MPDMSQQIGQEIANLRSQLEQANQRVAELEGVLIEIRRRDMRFFGTVDNTDWGYDGPYGALAVAALEKSLNSEAAA